jgi:putative transposase
MSRGNRKEPIFIGEGDRLLFLDLLRQVVMRQSWRVFAYCLMWNHYHLVLETPGADLSSGMRTINGEYAQWFNKVHGLVGHVFQGRFQAVLVESDWHFLELSRYLAMNPVRANLCDAPADWPWGSYRVIVDGEGCALISAERTLRHFGRDPRRARESFREFIEASSSNPDDSFSVMSGPDPDMTAWDLA